MQNAKIEWRSRVRLVDEVADALRSRIYAGRFPLGTPMRQEQLAAELDVSRTPLREALRMLEREGLVRVEPGRSVRVISGDLTTLTNAYAVREVVDGLAARLVAEQGSGVILERLAVVLEQQGGTLDPWDPTRYTETNVAFHSALVEAAENDFLRGLLPLVPMTSQVFIPIARVNAERAARALREHYGIVEAIRSRDGELAERLAREHIKQTIRSLVDSSNGAVETLTDGAKSG